MKKFFSILWKVFYVEPKNRLCCIQSDKLLHFIVSFIIFMQMSAICSSWIWALVITFAIGVFKEVIIDKMVMNESVDVDDLWADAFGILAALVSLCLMSQIYLLIWK